MDYIPRKLDYFLGNNMALVSLQRSIVVLFNFSASSKLDCV